MCHCINRNLTTWERRDTIREGLLEEVNRTKLCMMSQNYKGLEELNKLMQA